MHLLTKAVTSRNGSPCCGATLSYVPRVRGARSHYVIVQYVAGIRRVRKEYLSYSLAQRVFENAVGSASLGLRPCSCEPCDLLAAS